MIGLLATIDQAVWVLVFKAVVSVLAMLGLASHDAGMVDESLAPLGGRARVHAALPTRG